MNNRGFTIGSMLLALGIAAALSAISLVGTGFISREMDIRSADETARTIYIAAQNRLDEMKWSGEWETLLQAAAGTGSGAGTLCPGAHCGTEPSDYEGWLETYYDAESAGGLYTFGEEGTVLYLDSTISSHKAFMDSYLLPLGSVDESIRQGDSYVIEYNPYTAAVYSVIYAGGRTDVDYESVEEFMNTRGRGGSGVTEAEARSARRDFTLGDEHIAIGYYGGGISTSIMCETIAVPVVSVINDEDLIIRIENPNEFPVETYISIRSSDGTKTVSYYVSKDDGCLKSPEGDIDMDLYVLDSGTGRYLQVNDLSSDEGVISILLDSVSPLYDRRGSQVNGHSASLLEDFMPGDNLDIDVDFGPVSDYLALPATTRVTLNSLFKSMQGNIIEVSSLRHLENLSGEISGFSAEGLGITEDLQVYIRDDISYMGACSRQEGIIRNYDETGGVAYRDGSRACSYIPVNNKDIGLVDGDDHRLMDLKIEAGGLIRVGVFGEAGDITFRNLGLISHTELLPTPVYTLGAATAYGGGLVGECDELTIEKCYSTTRLMSSEPFTGEHIYAGGFAGLVRGDLYIRNSYLGGYAPEGRYDLTCGNIHVDCSCGASCSTGGLAGGIFNRAGADGVISITGSYSDQSIYVCDPEVKAQICMGGLIGEACVWGLCNLDISGLSYHAAPMITTAYDSGTRPDIPEGQYSIGGIIGSSLFPDGYVASDYAYYIDCFCGYAGVDLTGDFTDGTMISMAELKDMADEEEQIETLAIASGLAGSTYPYPDSTGLGHHYGDWQEVLPAATVILIRGHGLSRAEFIEGDLKIGQERSYEYGETIGAGDLFAVNLTGYRGLKLTITEGGRTVYEGEACDISLQAGLYDMVITAEAAALSAPDVILSGDGLHTYGYEDGNIDVLCNTAYPEDGSVKLHIKVGYEDGTKEMYFIIESLPYTGSSLIRSHVIDSLEYVGTRRYKVKAYAYDGTLVSETGCSEYLDITFVKVRQPVDCLSGGGWFLD